MAHASSAGGPVIDRFAARPGSIGETGQTVALEATAPQQHCHLVHAEFGSYPFIRDAISCREDDAGAHRQPLLGRSRSQKRVQTFTFFLGDSPDRQRQHA